MEKKIVILDGYVANSGDLSWDRLKKYGELTVYDRTPKELVAERIRDAWAVITNKVVITDELMAQAPNLKLISVLATGYNNVDIAAAQKHGITVSNVPSYSSEAVAQLVFALLFSLTTRPESHSESVKRGDWGRCADFSYRLGSIEEVSGMTMGIIGYGNIGKRVGEIAHAFGMEVITNSQRPAPYGVDYMKRVDTEELFRRSDVLSLNSALTPATEHIVNAKTLAMMKPNALIINTARGGLVDENALAEALRNHTIAGAAVDVIAEEPPRNGSPLFELDNCVITPHIAWQTKQARARLLDITIKNVAAFAAGKPINKVS